MPISTFTCETLLNTAFSVIVKLRRRFVESSNEDGRGRQHYTLHAVARLVTWTSDPQPGERGEQHGSLHLLHPGQYSTVLCSTVHGTVQYSTQGTQEKKTAAKLEKLSKENPEVAESLLKTVNVPTTGPPNRSALDI